MHKTGIDCVCMRNRQKFSNLILSLQIVPGIHFHVYCSSAQKGAYSDFEVLI